MPGLETSPTSAMSVPRPASFETFRGNERGRGRGRGSLRGDRGGLNGNTGNRRGGRAEFSSDRPNFDKTKTTIVVENIPAEKFSEDSVRDFFSEFGNISENGITMKAYKNLAIIKYDDWASAKAAYSSPKVIFDNRFVKVYWYTNDESLPRPPAVAGTSQNGNGTPVPSKAQEPSEPPMDIEEFTRKQQEVQKAHEEKMKKKAEMETAQKELERRHEVLLKKQAEEKRKLMEKLAAKSNTQPVTDQNGTSTTPADEKKPTSQTEALKAQLAALEAEAKSLGLDTALPDDTSWGYRGRGRGRGVYRGRGAFVPRGGRGFDRGGYRGRGGAPYSGGGNVYKLDNRPKKIAMTGIDFTNPDKDESLRQYLLVSHLHNTLVP
jgi:RNA-binding protein 26